ncbi:MAG: HD domain-containing protein [Methylococcaceae bacterium]|nr:HD domain-containing protein [Prolixibacteraceae bacterium]
MDEKKIVAETEGYISSEFAIEGSGHDWFHVDRVRKLSMLIGAKEGSDPFVTEMSALLHDLDDWKIAASGVEPLHRAKEWLRRMEVSADRRIAILNVIEDISFKGAKISTPVRSLEAAVVQDADRLDAIGAIGIARTFAYGGHKNRLIYDPAIHPVMHDDFQAYQNSTAPTVNHFYEKLLLLKERMNTQTAVALAKERHQFMESFLEQFFNEWEAKK